MMVDVDACLEYFAWMCVVAMVLLFLWAALLYALFTAPSDPDDATGTNGEDIASEAYIRAHHPRHNRFPR